MKNAKLSGLSNHPERAAIAIGLLTIVVELLIMMVIEDAFPLSMHKFLYFFDPILLVAFVSPALYFLIFRPMRRQQAELEDAHKKINEAFQEWIAALDAVNDPIFLHDKDFRILRCNKAYQQCAGIPFHEIIGQIYYEIFPKTGVPLPCCLRAMEKAEEEEEEEEELAAGGAIYRSRAVSIKDEQGVYLYSVHTFEDITERKRAEEELRLRAQLLDSTADSIFVHDFDGNFVYMNEAGWKTRGYTRDELMGMNLHVLDTPEYEKLIGPRIRELMEKGQNLFEAAHRRKDGSVMPVEISARIIESGGRKLILTTVRDITERKRADTQIRLFRELLDQSNDSIFIVDPATSSFLDVNETACRSLRYARDELLQRGVTDIQTTLLDPAAWQAHLQELRTQSHASLEFDALRKDGSRFPVEASIQYVTVANQAYIVAVVRDVTERKRAEAALSEQLEELRGWHDVTLGREMRVLELKREVDELLRQSGQPPRYPNAESEG